MGKGGMGRTGEVASWLLEGCMPLLRADIYVDRTIRAVNDLPFKAYGSNVTFSSK